jgi:hypothetical protein
MMDILITKSQKARMKHALGLNKDPKQDRNYFYCSTKSLEWEDLVEKGLATKDPGWDEESAYYRVTEKGINLIQEGTQDE